MPLNNFSGSAAELWRNAAAFTADVFRPTIRLGVTGLARSGKTVFITSLIHNLITGGRLPFFDAAAQGRLRAAYLEPQPDDQVPRFDYETHLAALTHDPPRWPEGTRRLSQLRLTLDYERPGFFRRQLGSSRLHVDIVDYPGEWLLDLPLLDLSFEEWSRRSLELSRTAERRALAAEWSQFLASVDAQAPQDENLALRGTDIFTCYLRKCREGADALTTVPPGRFLMPGDLAGSPALTFMPLDLPMQQRAKHGSLWAMLARRYESYKHHIVKPFFRDHFARLDRQIVLVDALAALNGGPGALGDLERAITEVLSCFRPGANTWLSSIFNPRIGAIMFAATKADHLHHSSHDRLEAILGHITRKAIDRAAFAGAKVKVAAIAAVRATREAELAAGDEALPCIMGIPLAGEKLGKRVFNGEDEIAVFPGDLPEDPAEAMLGGRAAPAKGEEDMRFIRFRPPRPEAAAFGEAAALPHIRLDRALHFLLGDRLQ